MFVIKKIFSQYENNSSFFNKSGQIPLNCTNIQENQKKMEINKTFKPNATTVDIKKNLTIGFFNNLLKK